MARAKEENGDWLRLKTEDLDHLTRSIAKRRHIKLPERDCGTRVESALQAAAGQLLSPDSLSPKR